MKNIAEPTTLTCAGSPRWAAPHTNIGKVTVEPELKFVMMKSSNDSEKASSAPATMPGRTSGNVTFQNVVDSLA